MQPSELLLWFHCVVCNLFCPLLHAVLQVHSLHTHFLTGSTDDTDASVLWCPAVSG